MLPRVEKAFCCLGLKAGCVYVGCISIFGGIFLTAGFGKALTVFQGPNVWAAVLMLFLAVLWVMTSSPLLSGLYWETRLPIILLPYIVGQLIQVAGNFISAIIYLSTFSFGLLGLSALFIVLHLYFACIVWSYGYTIRRSNPWDWDSETDSLSASI